MSPATPQGQDRALVQARAVIPEAIPVATPEVAIPEVITEVITEVVVAW
jgi:hypothetical protein